MIPISISRHSLKNNKGQTLVIIFFIMVLALTIGIAISERFIGTIRRFTQADESSRAYSAAEAGIERFLIISNETLATYINNNSCGANCHWEVTTSNGQTVVTDVQLSFAGNSTEPYILHLSQGSTGEVSLTGYTSGRRVDVCWDSLSSIYASYVHQQGSLIETNPFAYNASNAGARSNGFSTATALNGHTSCFSVTAQNTPQLLRLKAYYADADIFVLPEPGNVLPLQGIIIESTGSAGDVNRSITVLKTDPQLPGLFDHVLYQDSASESLSNR